MGLPQMAMCSPGQASVPPSQAQVILLEQVSKSCRSGSTAAGDPLSPPLPSPLLSLPSPLLSLPLPLSSPRLQSLLLSSPPDSFSFSSLIRLLKSAPPIFRVISLHLKPNFRLYCSSFIKSNTVENPFLTNDGPWIPARSVGVWH